MLVGWFLIYFELFDVIQKRFWQRGRYVGQMTMFLYMYTKYNIWEPSVKAGHKFMN